MYGVMLSKSGDFKIFNASEILSVDNGSAYFGTCVCVFVYTATSPQEHLVPGMEFSCHFVLIFCTLILCYSVGYVLFHFYSVPKCVWFHNLFLTSDILAVCSFRLFCKNLIFSYFCLLRGYIQKFPDWVDNEINNNKNNDSLRSNTKGYGGRIH